MKKTAINFTTDRFQITAWGGSYSAPRTEDYYQSLEDACFSHIVRAEESELDAAERHHLKLVIRLGFDIDWNKPDMDDIRAKFQALFERVGKHPALAGYFLCDEPHISRFDSIGKVRRMIREIDPDHEAYVNLLPCAAEEYYLGTKDYDFYLESYWEKTSPDWIGSDYYALRVNGPDVVENAFWDNLAAHRRLAEEHEIYFRFILLATAHRNYRAVSEDDVTFQAFAALAYGAKALEYYTYVTLDLQSYRCGPLDQFGGKTPTWQIVALVNRKIQTLARLLNRFESTKVYHFSQNNNIPTGQGCPADSIIEAISGQEILVGEFRDPLNGDQYVLIVNKDLHHTELLEIALREPDKRAIRRVAAVNPDVLQSVGRFCWIAPGGYQLMKLVPKEEE